MPVTDFLERNARLFGNDTALVELNPYIHNNRRLSWKDFSLMEPNRFQQFRRHISWSVFDEMANRCANFLINLGIKPRDKVAIIMYNCIDWLPIYFGILKSGAIAVPFNFRYSADEILYCANLADVNTIFFGEEFIGRIESISDKLRNVNLIFVGDNCPSFADPFHILADYCSSLKPNIHLSDDDDAAIYFSSGTTGFPKAILHNHLSLSQAAVMEQKHHLQSRDDCFLCIPPLYHTGAKFHWMGSLVAGSLAVLLKGTSPEVILRS